MANNKVVLSNGTVILDITDTTATASDVAQGKYFYTKAGVRTAGTASGGGSGGEPTSVKIIFATDSNGFILLTDTAEILTASGVSF